MSEASPNSALVELLEGISDRRIRRKVKKLLDFGTEAVRSLGELDSALYLRGNAEEQLQIVSDAVLSHVRRLLEMLHSITAGASEDSIDEDVDFAFAAGDSLDTPKPDVSPPTKERRPKTETDQEKWHELVGEMDVLEYGLGSELREFDRRFSEALEHDRKELALRDLNDATSSLMDGVFAMMTTVYERFLGYADPDHMIPGHRDTIGKTLAVRRGLTELRREVQELNRSIQNPESSAVVVEMSYKLLVESLIGFINADVYSYLRPGDRREFEEFAERLLQGDAERSRLDCEGLDKYLDSLSVVSQRDVLLKHDAVFREAICEELEAAMALADGPPSGVAALIDQAFTRAEQLFGLNDELDTLVFKWSILQDEKKNNLQEALQMGRSLRALVQSPG